MADHVEQDSQVQDHTGTLLDVDRHLRSQLSVDNVSEIRTIVDPYGESSKKEKEVVIDDDDSHVVVDWDGPDDPQNPKKCVIFGRFS